MLGFGMIFAHLVGDYLLQNHWMANLKTERSLRGWVAATVHGVVYTLPFLFLTQSLWALLVIAGTHIIIDHYRLAKHVVWFRNQLAPSGWRTEHTETGGPADGPPWLHFWLLFIVDNTIHIGINALAILYL